MDFIENSEVHSKKEVQTESTITNKIRKNPWILSTLVLAILSLLLIFGIIGSSNSGKVAVSEENVAQMLIGFFASQGITGVSESSVGVVDDFYEVNLSYKGQIIPFYVSKSGYFTGNNLVSILPKNQENVSQNSNGSSTSGRVQVSLDDDAVKGNPDAPVTIVEFSDYECPFCGKHFRETYPSILKNYVDTGKVKIVFRDFPLSFHPDAEKAAEAAECAGEFGDDKYWEMHDKLYNNQDALSLDDLKQYALDIGLDSSQFNDCLDSGKMADEVQADMEEGANYGVQGTPAFFINGISVSGAQPYSEFSRIIDEELSN